MVLHTCICLLHRLNCWHIRTAYRSLLRRARKAAHCGDPARARELGATLADVRRELQRAELTLQERRHGKA